ncbi:divergent PAP2 family protein [Veillonella montpellierensis]|uniref:divergent PAP2 family protein n=1 Tax=Veillonella montpellierensis TaxID=187328 RepID=UPI0023F94434|nr:divergent PAP2 family protein [Veillonella montpellierensis]
MDTIIVLFHNYVAQSAFWGWFGAQLLKFFITLVRYKTFSWERLVGSGGFPSSHTSFVIATTTSIAIKNGVESDIFILGVVVSCIVMYDASGVRREAGKQAQILNQLIHYFKNKQIPVRLDGATLKELLGHTPFEVFGGLMLGILIACIQYFVVYGGAI